MVELTEDNWKDAVFTDLLRLQRVAMETEPCSLTEQWNAGNYKLIRSQRTWFLSEHGIDDDNVLRCIETFVRDNLKTSVTADYIRFVLVRNFLDHYVTANTGLKRRKLDTGEDRRDCATLYLEYIGSEAADVRIGIGNDIDATVAVATGASGTINTTMDTYVKTTTILGLAPRSEVVLATVGETEILRREITVTVASSGHESLSYFDRLVGTWHDATTATIDLSPKVPFHVGDVLDGGLFRVTRYEW